MTLGLQQDTQHLLLLTYLHDINMPKSLGGNYQGMCIVTPAETTVPFKGSPSVYG
jgi:hypothetical protein